MVEVASKISRAVRPRAQGVASACVFGLGVFVLYLGLMSDFTFDVTFDEGFGLIFNDMLLRLLRGDFTSDPEIVGFEAFFIDGSTYTYFGIAPAFARLPLMPFFDLQTQSVARLTCAFAAAGAALFSTASVVRVAAGRLPGSMIGILCACCVLSGLPFILTLRADVYFEATLWAVFFASAYAFTLVRTFDGELGWGVLLTLAIISGITLNTRATTGFGLCLGTSLILAYLIARACFGDGRLASRVIAAARLTAPAIAVLAMFSALFLYVNYMRWGDPFELVDLSRQTLVWQYFPDRPERYAEQGMANFSRLWFGLQYYFFPIWVVWDETGRSIFSSWMAINLDGAELPPSSFLLTHAVWAGLAWFAIRTLVRERKNWRLQDWVIALAVLGALAPAAFILINIYMALRYQVEFYPIVLILALYGLHRIAMTGEWPARRRRLLTVAAVAAIAASCITLVWAGLPLGPAHQANLPEALGGALTIGD